MKIGDYLYLAECRIEKCQFTRALELLREARTVANSPSQIQSIIHLELTIERKKNRPAVVQFDSLPIQRGLIRVDIPANIIE